MVNQRIISSGVEPPRILFLDVAITGTITPSIAYKSKLSLRLSIKYHAS